jgi:hypothetical protein
MVGGGAAPPLSVGRSAPVARKNQKSLPRVECTIPLLLLCNAGYEIVQVSVVGTLFVRWSSGMDDEERLWSNGKIVMP